MSLKPLVSVVLPVYNGGDYLAETIESILAQTFKDFEFIIVNDGSSDNSQNIIRKYAAQDKRILALNQKNKGLVTTLNESIRKASGMYIARVDADDPSYADRLEKQVQLMELNSDAVIVGGGFEIVDTDGRHIKTVHTLTRDEDLRRALTLYNPFGHAGILFRKESAVEAGLYASDKGPAEDYDLWIRLSKLGQLTALPQVIYRYRVIESGISQSNSAAQTVYAKLLSDSLWEIKAPRVLSRRETVLQSNRYLQEPHDRGYGIGLKMKFLEDNAYIGTRLLRQGKIFAGVSQLWSVASVGRSGLRTVAKRLFGLNYLSYTRKLIGK